MSFAIAFDLNIKLANVHHPKRSQQAYEDVDEVVFEDGNIQVTKTLLRVGDVSYPINGIGSVLITRASAGPWYGMGLATRPSS